MVGEAAGSWHKIFLSSIKLLLMNIDRNDLQDQGRNSNTPSTTESERVKEKVPESTRFTEVKNAHASGLGSMGRSDEKLTDKDKRADKNDAVY